VAATTASLETELGIEILLQTPQKGSRVRVNTWNESEREGGCVNCVYGVTENLGSKISEDGDL